LPAGDLRLKMGYIFYGEIHVSSFGLSFFFLTPESLGCSFLTFPLTVLYFSADV